MRLLGRRLVAALVGGVASAQPAFAHEALPGVEGFAALVLHPLLVPEQAMCLLVAALIAGRLGSQRLLQSLGAVMFGMLAGKATEILVPQIAVWWRAPMILACAAAAGAASFPRLPSVAGLVATFALGFAAAAGIVAETPGPEGTAQSVAAALLLASALIALVGLPVMWLEAKSAGIGPQIAGAWLFAITAMNIALGFRPV